MPTTQMRSIWLLVLASATLMLLTGVADADHSDPKYGTFRPGLHLDFYNRTCPSAKDIVLRVIRKLVLANPKLPAQLVRLHFHDCFVRGCDASVMIVSTPDNSAELDSRANRNSLKGLDEIKQVKEEIEKECRGVVSCADIIALAARDSLVVSRGVSADYPVPLGRRDGSVSKVAEADAKLPGPFSDFTQLTRSFAVQNLSMTDLVVLSGAHTFGVTHCNFIYRRLYNFSSTSATDPALDTSFANDLKKQCPISTPQSTAEVMLDPTLGGRWFDEEYYENVLEGKGTFVSDNALITDAASRAMVTELGDSTSLLFLEKFGISMVKMGQIDIKTGSEGTIHTNCSRV